ncbi:MAG TPA: hypothetical protein VFD63_12360 [Pyrinomonadaceae bacterium]|nr:hypothetical protein [Pyrinomonadaceae bacterium]
MKRLISISLGALLTVGALTLNAPLAAAARPARPDNHHHHKRHYNKHHKHYKHKNGHHQHHIPRAASLSKTSW